MIEGPKEEIVIVEPGGEPQPEPLSKIERRKLDSDIWAAERGVRERQLALSQAEAYLAALLAKRRSTYGS